MAVSISAFFITQKRMIPKCSNFVYGMTLGYHRNDLVFVVERSKVKVAGSVSAFFTIKPMLKQQQLVLFAHLQLNSRID